MVARPVVEKTRSDVHALVDIHVRPVVRLVTRVVVPTLARLFLQHNIHTKCDFPRNVMHWRRRGGANKVKRHRICLYAGNSWERSRDFER